MEQKTYDELYLYIEDWLAKNGEFGVSQYIQLYSMKIDGDEELIKRGEAAVNLISKFFRTKELGVKDLSMLATLIEEVDKRVQKARRKFFSALAPEELLSNFGERNDTVTVDLWDDKGQRAARYYASIIDDQDYANAIETRIKKIKEVEGGT